MREGWQRDCDARRDEGRGKLQRCRTVSDDWECEVCAFHRGAADLVPGLESWTEDSAASKATALPSKCILEWIPSLMDAAYAVPWLNRAAPLDAEQIGVGMTGLAAKTQESQEGQGKSHKTPRDAKSFVVLRRDRSVDEKGRKKQEKTKIPKQH